MIDEASAPAVALRLAGVSKTFPGTRALQDVGFVLQRGEVHALMGGNGSGKSTLIKILAGVQPADPGGVLEVAGVTHEAAALTPPLARAAGLRFVHQHPTVFDALSVADNLAIGHGFPVGRGGRIRRQALHRRAASVLARFDIPADPAAPLATLGPAAQTMVAIARALQDQDAEAPGGVLVLDEPTAALPKAEAQLLLDALRRYAARGQAIMLVSHRLDEVGAVADRVTVLRDGRVVWTKAAADIGDGELVEAVVGGAPADAAARAAPRAPAAPDGAPPRLQVADLAGGPLAAVSFTAQRGEILGIAGLLGAGRTELLQMLFGARPRSGVVRLDGTPLPPGSVRAAAAAGVAYVPEDRPVAAAFATMSVTENLSVTRIRSYWRRLKLDARRERSDAEDAVGDFLIRAASASAPLATLSGGNQQKVILARWLARRPKLLLLDEPTQGVDVGARAEIYQILRDATAGGCACVVVSSDFEELAELCDRVVVLTGGRLKDLDRSGLTSELLTHHVYAVEAIPA